MYGNGDGAALGHLRGLCTGLVEVGEMDDLAGTSVRGEGIGLSLSAESNKAQNKYCLPLTEVPFRLGS